jgi:CheY-like chemotaxis protein
VPTSDERQQPAKPGLLVVDPAVLVLLRQILSHEYQVVTAVDGREAIAICPEANHIALLLTDVMMPGIAEPEVVYRCRQSRPGLAYLCMSGYADTVLRDHGVDPTTAGCAAGRHQKQAVGR